LFFGGTLVSADSVRSSPHHHSRYRPDRWCLLVRAAAGGRAPGRPRPPRSAGQLVAFAREDRSSLLREAIARAKARGALNLGIGNRAIAHRAAAAPHFINAVTVLADGDLVPVPGGVLIRDEDGTIIGAVGVSGHLPDDDEDCAVWGITACGLFADPGE
jgi:uncharacterized protein GlcG (DUF336 family)